VIKLFDEAAKVVKKTYENNLASKILIINHLGPLKFIRIHIIIDYQSFKD